MTAIGYVIAETRVIHKSRMKPQGVTRLVLDIKEATPPLLILISYISIFNISQSICVKLSKIRRPEIIRPNRLNTFTKAFTCHDKMLSSQLERSDR